ncbi:hypothetical protein GCM10020000_40190 [Streptomyces olivoverticillatus]
MRRWLPSWKLVLGMCVGFAGLIVGIVGVALAVVQVPSAQKASVVQKNVYYWADGKQMVVAGGGNLNRQIVPISQIPKSMQFAVISAENASFYQDWGVDPMGIARAVVKMAQGGETQSGSTITQQFVKNTYLSQEQTLKRKATELLISIKVGATQDKNDILAGYLNTAYYGRGAYGIQAAARAYYDRDCADLTPSQGAFLAATLNGPNLYDPYGGQGPAATPEKNLKRASDRWKWTLDREVQVKHMAPEERDKWVKEGFPQPQKPKQATNRAGQIGYLTDLADNYVVAHSKISKAELDKGGYQIYTTFDRNKVDELTKSVEEVRKANIKPKERDVDQFVQFGGASVEPKTGKIVAIYGGENALEHFTNNADYTGVQVGSTFKPFVLAAAMTHGKRNPGLGEQQSDSQRTLVSPESVYNGNNKLALRTYNGQIWHDTDGSEWHQRNDGDEDRGNITLRTAMQFSVNTPYIQLGMDVGTDLVRDAAVKAGLDKDQLASLTPPPSPWAPPPPQRDPAGRGVRDLRGGWQAGRPVLRRQGGEGRQAGLRARGEERAGLRRERGEQRHRRAEDRRRVGYRYVGAAGRPPGGGQDGYDRRQPLRLVRGLHAPAVDRDRHVPRRPERQEAGVPVDARRGRQADDPRCVLPRGDLGGLHGQGAQGGRPSCSSTRRSR